ncbi:MAG: DinB family protein [Dehalococcoidia bacterium]
MVAQADPADIAPHVVAKAIARLHRITLERVEKLSDQDFAWRPTSGSPSMAFHTWHMGRWADLLLSLLSGADGGKRQQVWDAEELAARWGIAQRDLGQDGTGMGLEDEASASLRLPERDTLLSYTCEVFAAVDAALAALDGAGYARESLDLYGRQSIVAEAVVSHLGHLSRHLGMIEALCGVQGAAGTATV